MSERDRAGKTNLNKKRNKSLAERGRDRERTKQRRLELSEVGRCVRVREGCCRQRRATKYKQAV